MYTCDAHATRRIKADEAIKDRGKDAHCLEHTGSQAVHPGYELLSDNTNLAAKIEKAGTKGNKVHSTKIAAAAGANRGLATVAANNPEMPLDERRGKEIYTTVGIDHNEPMLDVKWANEAIPVGDTPTVKSHLRVGRILRAVEETGAQAVHPGDEFPSENTNSAAELEKARAKFIGPNSKDILDIGDIVHSKKIATAACVSMTTKFDEEIESENTCVKVSRDIGDPVMVNISAGSGGSEFVVAWNNKHNCERFRRPSGDRRMINESFLDKSKEVEKILFDTYGDSQWLSECECFTQRRNQKDIEETSSSFVPTEMRRKMGEQTVQLAKAVEDDENVRRHNDDSANENNCVEMTCKIGSSEMNTNKGVDAEPIKFPLFKLPALPVIEVIRPLDERRGKEIYTTVGIDHNEPMLDVKWANEAIPVGDTPTVKSHLRVGRILRAVEETGAQAVHPGDEFPSENTNSAAELEKARAKFIGPNSKDILDIGDIVHSKKIATAACVSMTTKFDEEIESENTCVKVSRDIGDPVMVNISAGSGGSEFVVAWNNKHNCERFRRPSGDRRMINESFLDKSKEVEKILFDTYGDSQWLSECECFTQRRNQKDIEETSSSFVPTEMRRKMGEQTVQLAKAVEDDENVRRHNDDSANENNCVEMTCKIGSSEMNTNKGADGQLLRFTLFKLPYLPLRKVIRHMSINAQMAMSLCSRQCKSKIRQFNTFKICTFEVCIRNTMELHLYDDDRRFLRISIYDVRMKKCIEGTPDTTPVKPMRIEVLYQPDECEDFFEQYEWEAAGHKVRDLVEHFKAVFKYPVVDALSFFSRCEVLDMRIIHQILNGLSYEKFKFGCGSGLPEVLEAFEYFSPSKTLDVQTEIHEDSFRRRVLSHKCEVLNWDTILTYDDLMLTNSQKVVTCYNCLSEKELNMFIKNWQQGSLPRLIQLEMGHTNRYRVEDFLVGIEFWESQKSIDEFNGPQYDDEFKIEERKGIEIRADDGKVATIFTLGMDDGFFFNFFVSD